MEGLVLHSRGIKETCSLRSINFGWRDMKFVLAACGREEKEEGKKETEA